MVGLVVLFLFSGETSFRSYYLQLRLEFRNEANCNRLCHLQITDDHVSRDNCLRDLHHCKFAKKFASSLNPSVSKLCYAYFMHLFAHLQHILYLQKCRQICIVYSLNYQYDASVQEINAYGNHNRFVDLDKVLGFCFWRGLSHTCQMGKVNSTYLLKVTSQRHVDVCNYKPMSNSLRPVSKYFISSFTYVLGYCVTEQSDQFENGYTFCEIWVFRRR